MISEDRARELYVRVKALKEHQQKLESHLDELDSKTVQLREMITAVKDVDTLLEGDDILVPLANGIFMPATAQKTDHLILHVGADTTVKKTPSETVEILEKQLTELAGFREQLLVQYNEVVAESERVEAEVKSEVGDV